MEDKPEQQRELECVFLGNSVWRYRVRVRPGWFGSQWIRFWEPWRKREENVNKWNMGIGGKERSKDGRWMRSIYSWKVGDWRGNCCLGVTWSNGVLFFPHAPLFCHILQFTAVNQAVFCYLPSTLSVSHSIQVRFLTIFYFLKKNSHYDQFIAIRNRILRTFF